MDEILDDETLDAFLGARFQAKQPKNGFRAGTDTVLLASAIPASSEETVLELGAGSGVGLLCLGARVSGLELCGVEILAENARRANENLAALGLKGHVETGDALSPSIDLRQRQFHHVLMNPPFFDEPAHCPPQQADKSRAHIANTPLGDWVRAGCKRLRPKGSITIIHLAQKLDEILTAFDGVGNIHILPVTSNESQAAKRVIVQAWRQSAKPLQLLPPFIVNDQTGEKTTRMEEIARGGAGLCEIWKG